MFFGSHPSFIISRDFKRFFFAYSNSTPLLTQFELFTSIVQSFETLSMSNSVVFTSAGIANEIKLKPQALYPVGLV